MSALPPGPAVGPVEQGAALPRSARGDGSLEREMVQLAQYPPATGSAADYSFVTNYTSTAVHAWARKLGIAVNTRKETGSRIRVWRVSNGK